MSKLCSGLVGIMALVLIAQGQGRGAEADKSLDSVALREMLVGMGYKVEKLENPGGQLAFKIQLQHRNFARNHLVTIDAKTGTLLIIGGGFGSSPNLDKATTAWYRKLIKVNNAIAPNYIFINDQNVLGLTTLLGNVNITPGRLKEQLSTHVQLFDTLLESLVQELIGKPPPMANP